MRIRSIEAGDEAALQAFLAEFDVAGEARIPAYFCDRGWDHARIVEALGEWERGEGSAAEWVAHTTRFLADDGQIVGVINVRHALTERLMARGGHIGYAVRPSARGRGYAGVMLRDALGLLAGMGVERALITCGDANVASQRVIERCGGALQDITPDASSGDLIRRYWAPTGAGG